MDVKKRTRDYFFLFKFIKKKNFYIIFEYKFHLIRFIKWKIQKKNTKNKNEKKKAV